MRKPDDSYFKKNKKKITPCKAEQRTELQEKYKKN